MPRKAADGSAARSSSSIGPPPVTASFTPGSAATAASRSTRFSIASRPDVADDHLAARRDLGAQPLVAQPRAEPLGVHAAAPQPDPLEATGVQVRGGHAGRGESTARRVVYVAQPAPGERLGRPAEVVGAGVARQVRLVDGDRRQVLGPRDPGAPRAERDRAGQVHDLGPVPDDGLASGRRGQAEPEGRVAGQRHGRHPLDGVGELGIGRGAPRIRRDDQGVVPLADKVLRHAHYAVRDAVNVRRERLRNDRDPHAPKIDMRHSNPATRPLHPNERSMKVLSSRGTTPAEDRPPRGCWR